MVFAPSSDASPFAPLAPVGARRVLLRGGAILTMDHALGDLARGDILIEAGQITDVAPAVRAEGADVIDASELILIPGFVDCHRHAWEGQLRHLNPNSSNLLDYCCATHFSFGPHYRPHDIYVGNLLSAIGAIDHGITCVVDNCHNARTDDHAHAGLAAWLDAGVRTQFAPGPPSIGDWDEAGWAGARIAMLRRILSDRNADGLAGLAVMAQFVPEIWVQAREQGLAIITEVASPELAPIIRDYAARGLLGPDNIFNHITALPADILATLRDCAVRVNVCPRSDAQYGMGDGGIGTFQAALDAGLRPGLSIDNESSYSADMFAEIRAEFLFQRAWVQGKRYGGDHDVAAPISARRMLEAATIDGARCAGLDSVTGSLTPGKAADIIGIRATDRNLHPVNNVVGAVVQGADRANVDLVMIAGRLRKRGGVITGLDEAAMARMATASRDYLLEACGYHPDPFCEGHPALLNTDPKVNRYWA